MPLLLLAFVLALRLHAQTADQPLRHVTDPGVVTTRQQLTPAGVQSVFQGRVFGATFGDSSDRVWVLTSTRLMELDWRKNQVARSIATERSPGLQGLAWDESLQRPIALGLRRANPTGIEVFTGEQKVIKPLTASLGTNQAGAVRVANGVAVAALVFNNKLAVVDLNTGATKMVQTGVAPVGVAISADGSQAYVSNWGGRFPKDGELTAPTGSAQAADKVAITQRGNVSNGNVMRVDLKEGKVTQTIETGLHPVALAWDEAAKLLYVANTNSDSITIISSATNKVVTTLALTPFNKPVKGIAPSALALNSDRSKLYVACGGINAVAVIDTASRKQLGLIPTGWYPVSVDAKNGKIAVGSLLGAGSGWQGEDRARRSVHAYRGTLQVLDEPDSAQLASYTRTVAENNRMSVGADPIVSGVKPQPLPVPLRAGDPSLIEHVVFIVKENRTYDQLFGDLPQGNGEPAYVMFGEDVAPNHRKLAREFVLLDNFYATGGNSADGHQWVTQANQTSYTLWPGYGGRSYPYDGSDPIAYSEGGFLWDAALAAKKTVQVFGEYLPANRTANTGQRLELIKRWRQGEDFSSLYTAGSPIPQLDKLVARNFPAYSNAIPDLVRTQIFQKALTGWESSGKMPNLVLVQLPCDHTFGTTPGVSTPKAMVADNDWALGLMVESLSKSKFWPKMAIFVVEDDAQNGVDHVDGHRTVALVVSPYTRRQAVDSTFYSQQSMLKTIELMLGLPALSLFDMIANDMRASFQVKPDLTGYQAVEPKQDLMELNPRLNSLRGAERQGALASSRMNWSVPDAVPFGELNRILWHYSKGWNSRFPGVRTSVFAPISAESEEEDEDEH